MEFITKVHACVQIPQSWFLLTFENVYVRGHCSADGSPVRAVKWYVRDQDFIGINTLVPVADILISTPYGKMHDTGVGVSVRVARVHYVYIIILYRLHVAAVKCLLPICSDGMWRAIACLSLCFKTVVHRYFEGIALSKLQWPKLKILVWLLRVDWLFKNKTNNSHQKN